MSNMPSIFIFSVDR